MDLTTMIKTAGDDAQKAILAARKLGEQIREKQAKHEAVADLESSFDQARKDAAEKIQALNRLRAEQELETAARELNAPVETMAHRGHEREIVASRSAVEFDARPVANFGMERHIRRLQAQAQRLKPLLREVHRIGYAAFLRTGADMATVAMKALESYERHGIKPEEVHALMTSDDTLGGALVPLDERADVLRDTAGIAVFLANARVETTARDVLSFPSIKAKSAGEGKYPSGFAGKFKKSPSVTGGAAPPTQDQPKTERNRIPVHNWEPDAIEVERNLLEDSAADIEGMMREIIAETLALDIDDKCTNGTGVNEPIGILTDLADFKLPEVNSGAAATVAYGGLVDLFAKLPAQYRMNARFMMNTGSTFAAILKLEDTAGNPLFAPNQLPGTLWGRPIAFNEFMPDVAANAFPIVFGDFRGYIVAMRQDLRILRLVERFAPNIAIQPWSRVGGQTVRPNAFRRQKIAA